MKLKSDSVFGFIQLKEKILQTLRTQPFQSIWYSLLVWHTEKVMFALNGLL